ncbi:MAG: M15 family metallopeptidase [bacterium]|nr:M15 family metallopeptidase [bacterium]
MPKFSKKSKEKLKECHPYLQIILSKAIEIMDFTIICGHRGKELQNEAFKNGKSKLKYPKSKHNGKPSLAVDIAPYPIDWNDKYRFEMLAMLILKIAQETPMGKYKIQWGGHWYKFKDLPHFELVSDIKCNC